MFKIPNWEDDVPKSKVNFGKTRKNKKEKKVKETDQSPSKSSNQQTLAKIVNNNKKRKENKRKLNKNATRTNTVQVNGCSKSSKENNNNFIQNKQQNPHVFGQQKQSPSKKSGHHMPNGNTKQNSPEEHPSNIPTDKPKKKKSRKRKIKSHESTSASDMQAQDTSTEETIDISEPSKPKKKKFNDDSSNILTKKKKKDIQSEDSELIPQLSKIDKKKEKFRKILQIATNRNSINVSGNKLRERMLERLKAAQFRFLNEKLYTTSGSEAQKLFQSDPEAFHTYHQGYQQQLKKWPVNPLDLIVKRISKMPKTHSIADMGCGEAKLSKRVQQSVRSFDLVASAPGVEACDMAHTPLLTASVDAAVYCLALMGTDLTQYLVEANRVLKVGGHLLIAEVESRFDKVETFTDGVEKLGFKLKNLDKSHQVFYFMEFTKVRDPPAKKSKLPALTLKPCLYKKR